MATGEWATSLLDRLGIPSRLSPQLVQPGTQLGKLLPSVAEEIGASHLSVIAPACHDTGSAVVAVPAQHDDFAFLSSGTWSLLGVELSRPLINADTLRFNFTNEGGAAGTIRLLKSLNGMWIIQECQRAWAAAGDVLSYAEICRLAADAPPFVAVIDTDAGDFMAPGDMPAHIRDYCRRTGQSVPDSIGSMARTVFEGLAFKYRWVLEKLEQTLGRRPVTLHIVGGGSQNRLLNQFTADAIGRPVIAGPAEAASLGNILMQMIAMGYVSSLSEARRLVARCFSTETYEPQATGAWDAAYPRFLDQFGSIILT
jgi:sugar (pentulose or hexulose) kinase